MANSNNTSVRAWPKHRVVFLKGEIAKTTPVLLQGALRKINLKSSEPIWLVINTVGGNFYATLKIRAIFAKYRDRLRVIIYGKAYSAGALISQMGSKRIMTRKSKFFFHQASYTFLKTDSLNATELIQLSSDLFRTDAIQVTLFGEDPKLIETLMRYMKEERFVSAKEAKRLRFVDLVIPEPKNLGALIRWIRNHK